MAKTEKTTMRKSLLVDYFGDIIGEKDHKPPAVMVLCRLTCHQIKKPSLRTAFLLSLVSFRYSTTNLLTVWPLSVKTLTRYMAGCKFQSEASIWNVDIPSVLIVRSMSDWPLMSATT